MKHKAEDYVELGVKVAYDFNGEPFKAYSFWNPKTQEHYTIDKELADFNRYPSDFCRKELQAHVDSLNAQ